MKSIVYGIATRYWYGWRDCVKSWDSTASERYPYAIAVNQPIPKGFDQIYHSTTEPILAYIHDDLVIHEPGWDKRVLAEFEDESVGLVGFAGAMGHGEPHMYERPFHIPNLVRKGFRSNLRDAERHGGRISGVIDVSVLDGMALFVRRSVLDKWGGWPDHPQVGYFLYAEHLCCEVRRQGLRIRMVGVDCTHLGGKSSGTPLIDSYEEAHKYLYESCRDVLPAWVTR